MLLITDSTILSTVCAKLSQLEYVAVDTEFLRDKYYYPKLCLIQIAGPDEQYLIDPLTPNLDLAPLINLLTNPNIIKVFHSAKQDIETFYHTVGEIITPLYDTQIAAMALGYFSHTSYATLVADFLNKSLDKTEQFSQWDRRPLFPKQIQYAADDVRYLHMIYPLMQKRLKDRKRLEWVKEETNRLLDPLQYVTKPADAWQRLSLRDRSPLFLGIVKALAAWREQEAQSSNKPRTHILKDAALIDIATQRVKSQESLQKIRYANHLSQSQQQAIITAVQLGINEPKRTNTPSSVILNPEEKYITDMFKILLHTASKKHQVAERLIATGQELAELATNPNAPIPAFSDWRYEIFGKDLKALQEGKLALRLNNGKIELLEV